MKSNKSEYEISKLLEELIDIVKDDKGGDDHTFFAGEYTVTITDGPSFYKADESDESIEGYSIDWLNNISPSDGSTATYYQLPADCTELQHLISHRNMNAQDGEMFRAIYRKGLCSHSDELRESKKILFYAQAEVDRLTKLR